MEDSLGDKRLLAYIRRVNLDIMWSREGSTVYNNLTSLRKGKRMSEDLGLKPVGIDLGPWPVCDGQGFQVAIEMIRASQEEGRNDKTYVQFDTIRKIRSAYANTLDATIGSCQTNLFLRGTGGRNSTLTFSETDSRLFQMFVSGCEKRMGRRVLQELGVSLEVLQEVLKHLEVIIRDKDSDHDRKRLAVIAGATFVVLFGGALRGGEVLLMEAKDLCKRIMDGRDHKKYPHVAVPLMGRFKGETGERNVLLGLCSKTKHALEIRVWVERLVLVLRGEGKDKRIGPAICEMDGFVMRRARINQLLHEMLLKVQRERSDLLPAAVDVKDKFSIHRSFRRGAHTRAREMEVPETTIDMNNRWRKVERKSGSLPNLPMTDLYVELTQALASKLRFSTSL